MSENFYGRISALREAWLKLLEHKTAQYPPVHAEWTLAMMRAIAKATRILDERPLSEQITALVENDP